MIGRQPPELLVGLRLEDDRPTLRLVCFSAEDEQRLRVWIRANPGTVTELVLVIFDFEQSLADDEELEEPA